MANIYIRKDEVYRTRIEDVTNDKQFFYPVYQQARDCLMAMVDYTDRFWTEQRGPRKADHIERSREESRIFRSEDYSDHSRDNQRSSRSDDISSINPIRLRGYPNNIIAFSADRGHGKTSAMLSFSTALQALGDRSDKNQKDPDFWPKKLTGLRFFALDPIDPTVLETKASIIPVIISRMFLEFTNHARRMRPSSSSASAYESRNYSHFHQDLREQQQRLLQIFQDCYRLADDHKDTSKRSESYDDLQLLADRGDSSNFKERFAELVYSYLNFMTLDRSSAAGNYRDAFLIIQIDDADMNPEHAYEVVEDIRKYCVLPNVIILFATNMEQLELCVEQHFLKSFDTLLKAVVKDDAESSHAAIQSRSQCHSTAVNYLDKLVPSLHRINLPNINDVLQNYDDRVGLHHDGLHKVDQEDSPEEYQAAIAKVLNKKCLLDIHFQENRLHPFMPRHMRELTHFLDRLLTLEDVIGADDHASLGNPRRELMKWALNTPDSRDCSAQARILKRNLETMINYLVNDWSELNLKSWQMDTIKDIHRASAEQKIAVALESMEQKYFRHQTGSSTIPRSRPAAYSWSELLNQIAYFRFKQDHQFSSALELYFEMYKELLMVCDYINKREEAAHDA